MSMSENEISTASSKLVLVNCLILGERPRCPQSCSVSLWVIIDSSFSIFLHSDDHRFSWNQPFLPLYFESHGSFPSLLLWCRFSLLHPASLDGLLKCIPLSSFYPISSSPQQPHKLKRQLWSWCPHDGKYLRVPAPENLQQDALSGFVPSLPLNLVFLPILPSLCCTTSQTATVLNYLHILEWDMLYLALYPCYYYTYKTHGGLEKNADSDSRGLA